MGPYDSADFFKEWISVNSGKCNLKRAAIFVLPFHNNADTNNRTILSRGAVKWHPKRDNHPSIANQDFNVVDKSKSRREPGANWIEICVRFQGSQCMCIGTAEPGSGSSRCGHSALKPLDERFLKELSTCGRSTGPGRMNHKQSAVQWFTGNRRRLSEKANK